MQLILLTPPENHPEELEIIISCFRHGLELLHLRKPHFTNTDYQTYVEQIPAIWHQRIVLHGARHLHHQLGVGGIHINSHERLQGMAATLAMGIPVSKVSSSYHSWQEIADADTNTFGRLFISPLFNSISKPGYMAATPVTGIANTLQLLHTRTKPQIIGLGGIDATNINVLKEYGYNGAAVLGAVWQTNNPLHSFIDIYEKIL